MANRWAIGGFGDRLACVPAYRGRMSAAAVFELERTLFRGSSILSFAGHLGRAGYTHPLETARFVGGRRLHARPRDAHDDLVLARGLIALLAGRSRRAMQAHAERFAQEQLLQLLNPSAAAEIMSLQFRGIPVLLTSAAPQELADAVGQALGPMGSIGTTAHVHEGSYTGRADSLVTHGLAKAQRVAALLAEWGCDPAQCWAFASSVSDLPLLTLVGHPVAVKPDRALRAAAHARGWRLLPGSGDPVRPRRRPRMAPLP